jgi:ketosteroid isomerase-like protein
MRSNQKKKPQTFNTHAFLFFGGHPSARMQQQLSPVLFFVTLCLLFSPNASALPADSPAAEVTALIQRFVQAQKSYDPTAIKDVTAGNYVEVSPLGEVDTRQAVLGFYDPRQRVDVPSASVSEPDIRIMGDTALAIVAIRYLVAASGQPSHEVAMRATFVAMRFRGVWKLVSAQYTTIHPHEPQH